MAYHLVRHLVEGDDYNLASTPKGPKRKSDNKLVEQRARKQRKLATAREVFGTPPRRRIAAASSPLAPDLDAEEPALSGQSSGSRGPDEVPYEPPSWVQRVVEREQERRAPKKSGGVLANKAGEGLAGVLSTGRSTSRPASLATPEQASENDSIEPVSQSALSAAWQDPSL